MPPHTHTHVRLSPDDVFFSKVFFDVTIRGLPVGRIEFVLYADVSPLAAENFRAFCTGEGREGEGAGGGRRGEEGGGGRRQENSRAF